MKIDTHCSASSMSKPDSFRDILSLQILATDLPRMHLIDNFSYVVLLEPRRIVPVGKCGEQPCDTSGLANAQIVFFFLLQTTVGSYTLVHSMIGTSSHTSNKNISAVLELGNRAGCESSYAVLYIVYPGM